jgi:hypothetical protein
VSAGSLFGQAAGLALLAAIYPAAALVAALYLSSERPGKTTVLYVVGALVKVTVVGIVVLLVIRAGGLSRIGERQARYDLRLGLGVIAIIVAVVLYRRGRRQPVRPVPAKPKKPNLVKRLIAHPRPLAAFAVGSVMFGQSVAFFAAIQVVATANTGLVNTVGAMAVIIVLTVAFAWLPLVAYLIAPSGTIRMLRAFDGWLKRHGKTVLIAAIGIVGIFLVIQGISGLV